MIRRRFHLIPFGVTIPAEERDGELADKLRTEWSGILAWLVEGCLGWQEDGLRQPEAVRTATEAYLSAEDSLAAWLDEKCERGANLWAPSAILFSSWKAWADAGEESPGNSKRFAQALETRGFNPARKRLGNSNPVRGFEGLRLLSEPDAWDDR